ncbi:MAG: RpiB/LacA/LacB family sugar-phosphate isomerase [Mucinivorans sp.]
MKTYNIALAADHGGYAMKEFVAGYLLSLGHSIKDLGCHSDESVDYPDFAHLLAREMLTGDYELAFAFCGSANGISMTLNRHNGIRAALCWTAEIARLARAHNNANICSIPGRFVNEVEAAKIVDAFLEASFEGGRHEKRVAKIDI